MTENNDNALAGTLIGGAVTLEQRPRSNPVFRNREWDGIGDRVNHATNGTRAKNQCGGSTQYLDLIGQEWFGRHRVILAERRGIK